MEQEKSTLGASPLKRGMEKIEEKISNTRPEKLPTPPIEKVKQEAEILKTDTIKSPRKIAIMIFIIGVGMLLLGMIVALLANSTLIWLMILGLFIIMLLSDKVSS